MNKLLSFLLSSMVGLLLIVGCTQASPSPPVPRVTATEAHVETAASAPTPTATEPEPTGIDERPSQEVEGWAVLIEKDDYSDTGRPLASNIPTGFLDLHRLRFLLEYYQWDESHILEIRDEVDQDKVVDALDWLAQHADENDVVLFYAFAHGGFLERDLGWNDFFPESWQRIPSNRRVLVVSSCFAGRMVASLQGDPRPRLSIGSCGANETCWGGIWDEGLPIIGSVFTHFFALAHHDTSADTDGDWAVSLQEAARRAEEEQRNYMHEVVYAVPSHAGFNEQFNDPGSPHVVIDDTVGEPVFLDLGAYSRSSVLESRRAWAAREPEVIEGYEGWRVTAVAPDGDQFAYAKSRDSIRIINLANPGQVTDLSPRTGEVRGIAWSPDSMHAAVIGADWLQVWDVHAAGSIQSSEYVDADLRSVSWSQDGGLLAIGGSNGAVWVLDGTTWEETYDIENHPAEDVAWDPSGAYLAGGGLGGIWIWDHSQRQDLMWVDINAADVVWSPDGSTLGASCDDGAIHLWDVASGQELPQITYWAGMPSLAWSPTRMELAAGTHDGFTRVWDVATGDVVASMRGHVGSVDGIGWASGDRVLVAASQQDGTILLWEVP